MRCQRKPAQPEKVFPATMARTTRLWNLSGGAAAVGGAGVVVAVCGVTVACGAMPVAVYGATVALAVCGVTDSTVRVKKVYNTGLYAL